MSAIWDWGKRQAEEFSSKPWVGAVQEWRYYQEQRRLETEEKRKRDEEKQHEKSLKEGWYEVPESEEIGLEQFIEERRATREGATSTADMKPYNQSAISKEGGKSVQEMPKNLERAWQEHLRRCLQIQAANKGDRGGVWSQVHEGFESKEAEEAAAKAEAERLEAIAERHTKSTTERQKKAHEEAYLERGSVPLEDRRVKERTFQTEWR